MAVEYTLISGPADEESFEDILNKRADAGWRVVGFSTVSSPNHDGPGFKHYFVLARDSVDPTSQVAKSQRHAEHLSDMLLNT